MVTVIRDTSDGQTRTEVLASIQKGKAFFDIDADVEEGDLIEQRIANDKVVLHRVTDVTHHQAPGHFSAGSHIEADIIKAQKFTPSSTSQAADPLRILYLTSSPLGDLRVDKEVRNVKEAVRAATHRDMVAIEPMPAATGPDLLDGLTRFRPHVIHFSGHGNESMLSFDGGTALAVGTTMTAATFVSALQAVDQPPRLVVLNACKSEAQLEALTEVTSAAVGMSDKIKDTAAIRFAARFYAAIAEGQSIASALALSKVDLEIRGISGADLPTLRAASGVDPARLILVKPRP
ncbi:CHAT domain-containing protein [Micromonospora soli]|uniref:CHAT domain-containing protein n=1 Tax=Micromonospora sp. NBRC 110009 TaxID=3061627 RepID=UPI002670E93C|nr:CHAT domain-containing protein [Micromonospora sp. NBRC 110009]WKT97233.1 CHAT domain-containing protein [Micromonospora sp. NBRC 110009]